LPRGTPCIIIAPMHWIAPTEKNPDKAAVVSSLSASQGERAGVRYWTSAAPDQFRANSGLKSQEYSAPVLSNVSLCSRQIHDH